MRLIDRRHSARARSDAMLYLNPRAATPGRPQSRNTKLILVISLLLFSAAFDSVSAQTYTREMDTAAKVSLSVKSRNGRVSVIASDDQVSKVSIEASSAGASVDSTDVQAVAKGGAINIEVRDRIDKDRIDLVIRLPSRSKVRVETQAGEIGRASCRERV